MMAQVLSKFNVLGNPLPENICEGRLQFGDGQQQLDKEMFRTKLNALGSLCGTRHYPPDEIGGNRGSSPPVF
jgi:hypothetical protein